MTVSLLIGLPGTPRPNILMSTMRPSCIDKRERIDVVAQKRNNTHTDLDS
ncbi:MAG: hypothetical protein ACI8W7_003222 [Gammaproteobacteria bacterium]|jgi:hypothetical protein